MNWRPAMSLLLAAARAGCAVGPDFEPPAPPSAAQYRAEGMPALPAVVGEPARTNLFILSRTPTLDQDTLTAILAQLTDQGYDPARLIYDTPIAVP